MSEAMLFFDTETTGLPNSDYKNAKGNARVCQLGAILQNDERILGEINLIVQPNGWYIPTEVAKIHGITTETAKKYGQPANKVFSSFLEMMKQADKIVAHNKKFDLQLLDIEYYDLLKYSENPLHRVIPSECTMELSFNIVKCPPTPAMVRAGRNGFKNPSMVEAYKHFFGVAFEGAHDAMADVRACRDVYYAIKKMGAQNISS